MLRLTLDRSRYRWGDEIQATYTGDPDDLEAMRELRGTMVDPDGVMPIPFAGSFLFGAGYAEPKMDGYNFRPGGNGRAHWIGSTGLPSGPRTATITGAVTTMRGTTMLSAPVTFADRMAVGWCPPNSTAPDVTTMFAKFPETPVVRIFREPGDGLPAWNSALMNAIPPHVRVVLSVKETAAVLAAALDPWARLMPADRVPIDVIAWHEPEQQTGGDPTPAAFQAGWRQLLTAADGKPWRPRVRFGPAFTEYAATKGDNAPTWYTDFGIVGTYPGIDFVAFDIYRTGYSTYRTPVQKFAFSLGYADQVDKDLIVAEWCTGQRTSNDPTGEICARSMVDQATYLATQPRAQALLHFYRGGCNLNDRGPEREALYRLIRGGAYPEVAR